MALAITPFEGMCGFRHVEEIADYLTAVPELKAAVGAAAGRNVTGVGGVGEQCDGVLGVLTEAVLVVCSTTARHSFPNRVECAVDVFQQAVKAKQPTKPALQALFTALMKADAELLKAQLTTLEVACRSLRIFLLPTCVELGTVVDSRGSGPGPGHPVCAAIVPAVPW